MPTNTNKINSNFYQIAKTDTGGNNQVIGINISNVANLYLGGGNPGEVLTTDGFGNLSWGAGGTTGNAILQPIIKFEANAAGNNQSFTDANLATFIDGNYAAVYINGVMQLPDSYTINGNTLTINNNLLANETVLVGPVVTKSGAVTSVGTKQVDPSNLGFTLTGGTITSTGNVTLNVPNANALLANLGIPNIANVANYPNLSGNGNTYLSGNGTWLPTFTVKTYLMAHGGGLPPGIYPANTVLAFDTVDISSGITYDTTTGTLKIITPGTYRLSATMQSTVSGTQYSSGDISFIWRYANGAYVYPGTQTTADSYGQGSTYVGSQATNEIIVEATANSTYQVVSYYQMNSMLYDVNYVRLIVQQL